MPRLRNYIPYEDIEKEAKAFLDKYHPSDTIPIPIEEIIEQKLDFRIILSQSLQDSADIDGWTSIKTKEIYIDEDTYSSNTRCLRARLHSPMSLAI